jgi:hypothetical protein
LNSNISKDEENGAKAFDQITKVQRQEMYSNELVFLVTILSLTISASSVAWTDPYHSVK